MTVEGVPLNHLVGSRFWLGDTLLEAHYGGTDYDGND